MLIYGEHKVVVVLVAVTWFEMGKQDFRMAAQVVQVFVTDNILWTKL